MNLTTLTHKTLTIHFYGGLQCPEHKSKAFQCIISELCVLTQNLQVSHPNFPPIQTYAFYVTITA